MQLKTPVQDSQNPVHPVYPVVEKYVIEFMNESTKFSFSTDWHAKGNL